MAELPAFIFERQLQRRQGGGTPGAVDRPTVSGSLGAGEGLANLGRNVSQAADIIDQAERRFRAAREKVEEAEGYGAGLAAIDDVRATVLDDLSMNPLDRAQTFETQLKPRIDEITRNLSEQVKGRVMLRLAPQVQADMRRLRDEGRKDFITQSREGLQVVLEQLQRQELTADNQVDVARIRQSRTALVQQYAESGILTAAEGSRVLTAAGDAAGTLQLQNLMHTDPELALEHLKERAAGKNGVDGLYKPPAEKVPELLAAAQTMVDAQVAREDRLDRKADKDLAERQGVLASEYRKRIFEPGASDAELDRIQSEINVSRAATDLGEEDHAGLLNDIRVIRQSNLTEGRREDDDVRRTAAIGIETFNSAADLDRWQQYVRDNVERLQGTTVSTLLGRINTLRDLTNVSNIDEYRTGIGIIKAGVTGGVVEMTLDKMDNATKIRVIRALDLYRDALQEVFAAQGVRGVREKAIAIARRIRDETFDLSETVRTNLQIPSELEGLPYEDAVLRLDSLEGRTRAEKRDIFERLKIRRDMRIQQTLGEIEKQAPAIEGEIREQPGFLDRLLRR